MGFKPILVNQKTSLKEKCKIDDCLASEFDNIFYRKSKIAEHKSGIIHFLQAVSESSGSKKSSRSCSYIF
jgi:hypothetical protein